MPRKAVRTAIFSGYQEQIKNHSDINRLNIESGSKSELFSASEWLEIVNELRVSPRQAEVIWQLLQGRSDKQIARQLGLSVGTVRTHLDRLFLRFGLQDRSELILHVFHRLRRKCRLIRCPLFNLHETA